MEHLIRDPIIQAYFNFRNANEADVPVFSETVLRLAVKHVLQFKNQKEDDVLSMYKRLMTTMLHFDNGKTIDELEEIMICYNRNEIMEILDDTESIEDSWKIFTVEEMIYFIRKNAFFIIMSEWIRRYECLCGKIATTEEIGDMALRVHDYFNWSVKSVHQWKRSFESKFLRGNSKEFNDHNMLDIKESDLSIKKISNDLKDKLHPLVEEENLNNFVHSIKSIKYSEATNRFRTIFKRRLKDDGTFVQVKNIIAKDEFVKQTIEFIITDDNEEKFVQKAKHEVESTQADVEDDDVEYLHVVEITDDVFDDDDDENSSSSSESSKKTFTTIKADKIEVKQEVSNNNSAGNDVATATDQITNNETIINDEQAFKYLSDLQAYAVNNGLFAAIGLLDEVDSIFRTKYEKDSSST